MDSTRLRELQREATVTRLARRAVDGSGTRRAVARRWSSPKKPLAENTVSSYATRTVCPELRDLLRLVVRLGAGSDEDRTTARAICEAVYESYRLAEIENADSAVLMERAVYLHQQEPMLEAAEKASMILSREARREAMRAEAWAQLEYADHDEVLQARGEPDPRSVIRKEAKV
ncbi:MAG: hypothetical protein AMXMBFR53_36580 [Gemmatimonadota bacterium]